jgi:hypothetical protein
MFGRDVVLRALADVERCGVVPYLGIPGLDLHAGDLADVTFEVVAVGTRTAGSAAALAATYRKWVPGADPAACHGDAPWIQIMDEHRPDVLFVAYARSSAYGPDSRSGGRGVHVVAEKPLL